MIGRYESTPILLLLLLLTLLFLPLLSLYLFLFHPVRCCYVLKSTLLF
jgi:hypothetical protein